MQWFLFLSFWSWWEMDGRLVAATACPFPSSLSCQGAVSLGWGYKAWKGVRRPCCIVLSNLGTACWYQGWGRGRTGGAELFSTFRKRFFSPNPSYITLHDYIQNQGVFHSVDPSGIPLWYTCSSTAVDHSLGQKGAYNLPVPMLFMSKSLRLS